ncbi:MAG: NAD(P)/FAD-dependent oxidoreductase [Oscillospiraceae bacterium]
MNKKVLVIGGGASGLMAAGKAAENGNEVILLERNQKLARKVMITGKGRCNVTSSITDTAKLIENVPQNGRFLFSAFNEFGTADTVNFFENSGVPLKVERGERIFPRSDKASDIVDALNRYITKNNVKRKEGRAKELIIDDGQVTGVITFDGEKIFADSVIIATGGLSYPKTGSSGDGYEMAKKAGHIITPLSPSLVALKCREGFCEECMGLSLRNVSIKVINTENGKEVFSDLGEMLFTHFGVSGPMILSASAHMRDMKPQKYEIFVDLKPGLSDEKLDARIVRDLAENAVKNISNSLGMLLPRALIPVVIRLCGIKTSMKSNQITKEMRLKMVHLLKNLKLTVLDFCPIDEAIITSGGVKCSEINPKTMESKICKNLYFAGEVIDVDAYTGGFNLQIAFSTGYLAGNAV